MNAERFTGSEGEVPVGLPTIQKPMRPTGGTGYVVDEIGIEVMPDVVVGIAISGVAA
jgi:hypothetical protein